MLRDIFPDAPVDENAEQADNPGAFFSEFLPMGIPLVPEGKAAQGGGKDVAASKPATEGEDCGQDQQSKDLPQQQQQQPQEQSAHQKQQQQAVEGQPAGSPAQQTSANTAEEGTASAAAAQADQTAKTPNRDAAQASPQSAKATAEAAAAATEEAQQEDSFGLPDLPSMDDISDKLSQAKKMLFGDDGTAEAAVADTCERLLPRMLRSSSSSTRKAKPLRLKFAEQVLSKDMLAAVQVIEEEILSAPDPLPNATIKFFVKAASNMGKGWAHKNASKVFGAFGAYIAASCGIMHATKSALKWLAWRIPRIGRRTVGPTVSFTADVLLPTQFFGPFLATYVLVMLVAKPPPQKPSDDADTDEAAAAAASGNGAKSDTVQGAAALEQQSRELGTRQLTRRRSREVSIELSMQQPHRQLSRRHSLLRSMTKKCQRTSAAPVAAAELEEAVQEAAEAVEADL